MYRERERENTMYTHMFTLPAGGHEKPNGPRRRAAARQARDM